MNKFRLEMTPAEQREFLTGTRLHLSKEVKRILSRGDVYVIKHIPTGGKLRVSAEELFVLGQFARGATVAELIPQLVMNRRCLPLAKLYDLVLQARSVNILTEQRDEEFTVDYPLRWWPSLTAESAQVAWVASLLAFLGILPFGKISTEAASQLSWMGWLTAFVVTCVSASLGGLLASAYVHRAGGAIHRPRFIWRSLVPRIRFDWHDVDMVGDGGYRVVAKLRIVPFVWCAGLCAIVPDLQPWAPVAVAVLLWRVSPFPFTPASQWMRSALRREMLATDRPRFFYHFSDAPTERIWREFVATDWIFCCWLVLWTTVWCALVMGYVGQLFIGSGSAIFSELVGPRSLASLKLAAPLAGAVCAVGIAAVINGWWRIRQRVARYGAIRENPVPGGADLLQVLEDCPLFREVPAEVRAQLVKMARVVTVVSGQAVTGVGEAGGDFYIIAAGRVQVELARPQGKPDKVAVLCRGDVFGSFGFFGSLFRTQNMRALTDLTLVALSSPELESILKRHISIPVIEEIVQRRVFLRRIRLSAGWEPGSVMRFAKLARLESMREGQLIVGAGRENRFFYLVYDGSMEVRRRGRKIGRIAPGEFFGELSLLLNNLAVADIQAEAPSRCLVLQKSDFLELMGNDIELALQMEHVASGRYGRPIFPFDGSSIEAIAN